MFLVVHAYQSVLAQKLASQDSEEPLEVALASGLAPAALAAVHLGSSRFQRPARPGILLRLASLRTRYSQSVSLP